MIDYDKIGKRIQEQRKHILKKSQERMAEDLNMYQADISNLEKAKPGSGITDLDKLDRIAEYFGMSPQSLIFGGELNIPIYTGSKMTIRQTKKKIRKEHASILERLIGESLDHVNIQQSECGTYTIYSAFERFFCGNKNAVPKLHTFIFYKTDIIGSMTAYFTTLMQHVFQPHFQELYLLIEPESFDVRKTMDRYRQEFFANSNQTLPPDYQILR